MGDSLTAGVGDDTVQLKAVSYTDHLAELLRIENRLLEHKNIGQRGLTTSEIIDTQLAQAIEFRPDLLSISAGVNDIMKKQWKPTISSNLMDNLLESFVSLKT